MAWEPVCATFAGFTLQRRHSVTMPKRIASYDSRSHW